MRFSTLRRFVHVPLIMLCVSCAADSDPPLDDTDGKNDGPNGDGPARTSLMGIQLFEGYNRMLDLGLSPCVVPGAVEIKPGGSQDLTRITLVSSREELAKQLGVDLGLKFKFAVVDASAGVNFLNTFKATNTSVNVLVQAQQTYTKTNEGPDGLKTQVALTDKASTLLTTNPPQFLAECGNKYVSGVTYAAETSMLLQFNTTSEEQAEQLKANIGLTVNVPVVNAGGDFGLNLANEAKKQGVKVTMSVVAEGFSNNGENAINFVQSLLGQNLTAETFTNLKTVRDEMKKSIDGDICRDGGGTDCGPAPTNRVRWARPSTVHLRPYTAVSNLPVPNGLNRISKAVEAANDYVRALAALQNRMEANYLDEIAPFQLARKNNNVAYSVRDPAAPQYKIGELDRLAGEWEDKFRPEGVLGVGTLNKKIQQKLVACWNAVRDGAIEEECVGEADALKESIDADAALTQYKDQARISPVRFKVTPLIKGDQAAVECTKQKDSRGLAMRLATWDETQRLGIVVALGAFPRSTLDEFMVWTEHSAQTCTLGTQRRTFRNTPTGDHGAFCRNTNDLFPAVCVPTTGPFPGS